MNILLVCSYFGPETSVGVNRVNSFARHWLKQDCSIDVITMPFQGELPVSLQRQQQLTIHQVAPFLLTPQAQSYTDSTQTSDKKNIKRNLKDILYWLKKHIFANYLDPRTLWWPKAVLMANKICKEKKIDFILTSVPSYTAHSVGAVVKSLNPEVYWVADYRDLWSGNPIFPGVALVRWLERKHEQFILRKANLLVTINEDLALSLRELHQKRVSVVPNGVEFDDLGVIDSAQHKQAKPFLSIVYTGTVLSGLQSPEPLFKALVDLIKNKELSEQQIKVFFYGDANAIIPTENFKYLIDIKVVECNGTVAREVAVKMQREADILLFLGARRVRGGASVRGVISGKIFEYLVSGVEVMAIGVDETMIVSEMIQLAGAGDIYAEDIEKIKKILLERVKSGPKKVDLNMEYLTQFDRKKQANWLLSEIKKELV